MRCLVTGHRGLLGSACVRVLQKKHEVVTTPIDLFHATLFHDWLEHADVDVIVHCAARVGGVKANRDYPVDFLRDNLAINDTVIGAAAACGVKKLVNIGTSCLYPREAQIPVREDSLMTGPFEHEVEAYATAKLAAYQLCKAYRSQYGKNFVTVCPCNLYGIGDKYGTTAHVIPSLIKRFDEAKRFGSPVRVWGNGNAVREFMFADDTAHAIELVIEKYNSPELINIGTGQSTTIRELVDAIGDAMNFHPEIVWEGHEPIGIPQKTFDVSKLRYLGWDWVTSLEHGLKLTIADYLGHPDARRQ